MSESAAAAPACAQSRTAGSHAGLPARTALAAACRAGRGPAGSANGWARCSQRGSNACHWRVQALTPQAALATGWQIGGWPGHAWLMNRSVAHHLSRRDQVRRHSLRRTRASIQSGCVGCSLYCAQKPIVSPARRHRVLGIWSGAAAELPEGPRRCCAGAWRPAGQDTGVRCLRGCASPCCMRRALLHALDTSSTCACCSSGSLLTPTPAQRLQQGSVGRCARQATHRPHLRSCSVGRSRALWGCVHWAAHSPLYPWRGAHLAHEPAPSCLQSPWRPSSGCQRPAAGSCGPPRRGSAAGRPLRRRSTPGLAPGTALRTAHGCLALPGFCRAERLLRKQVRCSQGERLPSAGGLKRTWQGTSHVRPRVGGPVAVRAPQLAAHLARPRLWQRKDVLRGAPASK